VGGGFLEVLGFGLLLTARPRRPSLRGAQTMPEFSDYDSVNKALDHLRDSIIEFEDLSRKSDVRTVRQRAALVAKKLRSTRETTVGSLWVIVHRRATSQERADH
jgi:hypothetical protein